MGSAPSSTLTLQYRIQQLRHGENVASEKHLRSTLTTLGLKQLPTCQVIEILQLTSRGQWSGRRLVCPSVISSRRRQPALGTLHFMGASFLTLYMKQRIFSPWNSALEVSVCRRRRISSRHFPTVSLMALLCCQAAAARCWRCTWSSSLSFPCLSWGEIWLLLSLSNCVKSYIHL